MTQDPVIAVVGLGYVGLPLAVAFGQRYRTLGFDVDAARIEELRAGNDRTREVEAPALAAATQLAFTADITEITAANVYVVTVPTPIDAHNQPDLRPLAAASTAVGKLLAEGDVVIFESTVYPGATEEFCVPILERESGLVYNQGFFVGYSPERINPGDKTHRLNTITKVTAGSDPATADFVDGLYASIVEAGTHRAQSIRVAEAAKVIENTQRDVNIALMNELAMIFNRLGIETSHVLEAAGTKWNFLPFRPGLVGGHCIGVDPYYLTHRAQAAGYHPEMVLAGRRINDQMGEYVAAQFIKALLKRQIQVKGARVLVMGLSFKENCPDLRNTRVTDILRELGEYGVQLDVVDPWVDAQQARELYGIDLLATPAEGAYDGIILAVAHREFAAMGPGGIHRLGKPEHVLYDLKQVLPVDASDLRL
ncbi:nucleotide sugar dehydrogenase [Mangrovimicrobium sediminis]|uniref:Nucleotide sugar dehydrogenase n=1 Tax=Mangrovimicrobium sediminis TaxID=2562682 RepID=A0A4Z0M0Q4_9GAMM|nr:nucleotide sugar dehydrogenase [Haliea sp. SAOS-164]TGD73121.1 nucleotide sugar dehydrogenase [Haliea sp. SAOS-164]